MDLKLLYQLLYSCVFNMRKMMTVSLMIAISFGLVLASVSLHSSLSAFAQANSTKKNATSQQSSGNKSSGGGAAAGGKPSNTPPSTVTIMKGPKAAGTANQLNQIEGNNTQTLSKNTNIANKPGVAGLAGENNATGK